ncbi:MAG: BatA domain-containing protein [Bacteroidia bacterium]|nr:BatA domain-containing protein [Bacteroidia bacterium]
MSFLHPEFFYAFFTLLIPIIIHLFNFRRFKTVYFTNVKFLKEIDEDKRAKSKLRNLLILLTRLLALAMIILAFTQPFIPADDSKTKDTRNKAVSIYIDNSFSMNTVDSEGKLLDIAKVKAKEIASSYGQDDLFQILTNDFEGKHQRLHNKDDYFDLLTEIKTTPTVRNLSDIFKRQKESLQNELDKKHIYFIISDFQKSIADIPHFAKTDSASELYFIPLNTAQQQNISVDSCWFQSPILQLNQQCELSVVVKSLTNQKADNVPIQLSINGKQKALTSCSIDPLDKKTVLLSFVNTESGWQQAKISIKDYPITFDDTYYFSYHVAENINVYCINESEPSPFINAVFDSDPYFKVTDASVSQINYNKLKAQQLIILNDIKSISSGLIHDLVLHIENGGNLLVFPSLKADLNSYNELLNSLNTDNYLGIRNEENQSTKLNIQSPIFSNVFQSIPKNIKLPSVKNYYSFTRKTNTTFENLISFDNNESLISMYEHKTGHIFLSAVNLNPEISNLAKHAIFVPLLYKIALLNTSIPKISYKIGKDKTLELSNKEVVNENNLYKLVRDDFEVIPETKMIGSKIVLQTHDQIQEPGHYCLYGNNNNITDCYSFNFNRKESDLTCMNLAELSDLAITKSIKIIDNWEKDLSTQLNIINRGTELWKLCITFALIFLGIEVLLLRFWKS